MEGEQSPARRALNDALAQLEAEHDDRDVEDLVRARDELVDQFYAAQQDLAKERESDERVRRDFRVLHANLSTVNRVLARKGKGLFQDTQTVW